MQGKVVMGENCHCVICKRKLTKPKSIEQKMGDTCFKKYNNGYAAIQMDMLINRMSK